MSDNDLIDKIPSTGFIVNDEWIEETPNVVDLSTDETTLRLSLEWK